MHRTGQCHATSLDLRRPCVIVRSMRGTMRYDNTEDRAAPQGIWRLHSRRRGSGSAHAESWCPGVLELELEDGPAGSWPKVTLSTVSSATLFRGPLRLLRALLYSSTLVEHDVSDDGFCFSQDRGALFWGNPSSVPRAAIIKYGSIFLFPLSTMQSRPIESTVLATKAEEVVLHIMSPGPRSTALTDGIGED